MISQIAKGRNVQELCSEISWSQQKREASGAAVQLFVQETSVYRPPLWGCWSLDLGVVTIHAGIWRLWPCLFLILYLYMLSLPANHEMLTPEGTCLIIFRGKSKGFRPWQTWIQIPVQAFVWPEAKHDLFSSKGSETFNNLSKVTEQVCNGFSYLLLFNKPLQSLVAYRNDNQLFSSQICNLGKAQQGRLVSAGSAWPGLEGRFFRWLIHLAGMLVLAVSGRSARAEDQGP